MSILEETITTDDNARPNDSLGCRPAARASDLEGHRQSIRRFIKTYAHLPVATRAACPVCRQVGPAEFQRSGEQVVLEHRCERCGVRRIVHHDRLWTAVGSDFPGSPTHTLCGSAIRPVHRRLPRTVETLCPECGAAILGRYFVEDGAVFIEKNCPEHGYFRDCVNRDVLLYSKAAWWTFEEPPGLEFPQVAGEGACPSDCGLCRQHLSSPCLAQIDLTNRCNMRCPICFANANVAGYVAEPSYEQIVKQLKVLRELRPIPCTAIQFTGGEPTIHPDFLRIVSTARDMGFSHIQIATNGIRIADEAFARQAAEAGLHTLYLQFDGIGEEPYRSTRAYPGIWAKKLAAIRNCRTLGLKICLVPTILRGINDDQVGEIFRFAAANADVISAISYQPVSFTGRIDQAQLAARRYTLGDLAHDIAAASGASPLRDMYPLSVVVPFSQFLEAMTGRPKVRPSCHSDCAFGTYFLVSPEGQAVPFPQVVNIEGLFWDMNRMAAKIKARGRATWLDRWRALRMFKRHFNAAAAPADLTLKRFIRALQGCVDKRLGRGKNQQQGYRTLLCAGMHFQDRNNYDVERAKRCVILYSTPAGVFPFCSWNCGPEYRVLVERSVAAPDAAPSGDGP